MKEASEISAQVGEMERETISKAVQTDAQRRQVAEKVSWLKRHGTSDHGFKSHVVMVVRYKLIVNGKVHPTNVHDVNDAFGLLVKVL